jgi:hypothetical protein
MRKPHGKSLLQERDEESSRNGASNVLEGKRESLDNVPEGKTTIARPSSLNAEENERVRRLAEIEGDIPLTNARSLHLPQCKRKIVRGEAGPKKDRRPRGPREER